MGIPPMPEPLPQDSGLDGLFDVELPKALPNAMLVDWEEAPYAAGGYIAVNVDGKIHACWVMSPELDPQGIPRRIHAPTFGVSIAEHNGVFTMLRPEARHPLEPWIIGGIRAVLESYRIRDNAKIGIYTLPPEPGFKRPKGGYPRNELSVRIAIDMDAQLLIAARREARVQSRSQAA